jgi:hypothetical protein
MKLDLPPPRDWQVFEDLCRDLWAELWGDPNAQKHGRTGQKQRGVDVFGQPAGGGGAWEGVQCKRYERQPTRKAIEREVAEARTFKPPLRRLIVATTTKRDTGAQEIVREISDAEVARGSFSVSLSSWNDIADELVKHRDLFRHYYPALPVPKVPAPGEQPFEPWKPAVPPWFVGRRAALDRLESALGSRDGVSIVGDGKIGKSSLLQTWQQQLHNSGRKVCLIDGQGSAGRSEAAFVSDIIGRPAPEGADPAADALAAWGADEPEGLAPVVLVDELDHLPGRFDPRFFERLRNLLGNIVLAVASRREVDTLYREQGLTSPFANRLRLLRLGLLDEQAAADLIRRGAAILDGEDRALMRRWAGRHPFYLQLLGYALVEARELGENRDQALDRFDSGR